MIAIVTTYINPAVCLCQDEDASRGDQSVKDLVKTVNDRYRGFAEIEDEKER